MCVTCGLCVAVVTACAQKGNIDEQDMFAARAVLQVLAAANKQTANTQLQSARTLKQHFKGKGNPLDNFLDLLLAALSKGAAMVFDMARDEYAAALRRDSALDEMLDRIASVYLGRGGGAGGLGALLGSLLGGG